MVAGAAVLAVTGVVAGLNGPSEHQHDAGGHKHVTAGPDVRDLAADPTLSRAGWTAVADSAEPGYPASAVLDGNVNTIWHTQYSGGAAPLPHTITIDMHALNVVSGLRYLPRQETDNRGGTIGRFEIRVSSDGTTWGNPVASGTFADDAAEKSVPFPPTSGRYVRLTALTEAGARGQWSSGAEINLNGNAAPTLPRAGWTATADSAQPGYPASNMLDGNTGSIWHTPYGAGVTPLPHWVKIDMQAANVLTGLRYLPRLDPDNRGGTIGGYQVHVSNDNATWTQVATGTFADSPAEKVVPFTPVTARYIRLTALTEAGNRGPWSSGAELNVMGNPAPTLDRTGWSATADSQENRVVGYLANNVLDGDPGSIWQTKFVGTIAPLPHWITIDTKAVNVVSGVRYQPRTGTVRDGTIGGYQVQVSNDNASWTQVASGTWADDATEKTATFTPRSARYVRLTATTEAGNRGQWSTAAEINITGDLPHPNPRTAGAWGATVGFPIVPVAVAQLPNGKLLTWSAASAYTSEPQALGYTQTATMNLADGTVSARTVTNTGHDMFCPGTAALPDGRIMVAGGSNAANVSIYDPGTDSWTAGPGMNIPRGYESTVTLSDGRVFTIGGSWSGGQGGKNGEVWSQATGWQGLPGVPVSSILTQDPEGLYRSDNHPWLFALPGGKVFQAGPSKQMNFFDPHGAGTTTAGGNRGDDTDAMNGDAVLYDIGKILTTGGAPAYMNSNASNRAYKIDVSGTTATVTKIAGMNYRRAFHNSVVLPDGKVVVIGGESYAIPYSDTTSVLPAEIWDPATGTFTVAATMAVPRNYHSVATLLPDGRIFSGGGGLCGTCGTNHPDAQIFSPPYLYAANGSLAPRPAITNAPSTFGVGASIDVATDRAVSAFSLVRMGAVTHAINTDQRRIPLTATAVNGTSYTLAVPGDPGVVVPGYYMLFAMDANGVPSMAATVKIN